MKWLLTCIVVSLIGCDSGPRYERRDGLVIDRETGLTYPADDVDREREAYRKMLTEREEKLIGVPEVLTVKQRTQLAEWQAKEKAERAEKGTQEWKRRTAERKRKGLPPLPAECEQLAREVMTIDYMVKCMPADDRDSYE